MSRKRVYVNTSDEQLERFDKRLKQAGFKNRTEYVTASVLAFADGKDPFEWDKNQLRICEKKDVMQKTFFEIIDEKFFPIIAMKGTKVIISSNILTDIKRELLNRCDMLPEDRELEEWLEIYRKINNSKLAEHRARVTKERFEEEEEENA